MASPWRGACGRSAATEEGYGKPPKTLYSLRSTFETPSNTLRTSLEATGEQCRSNTLARRNHHACYTRATPMRSEVYGLVWPSRLLRLLPVQADRVGDLTQFLVGRVRQLFALSGELFIGLERNAPHLRKTTECLSVNTRIVAAFLLARMCFVVLDSVHEEQVWQVWRQS
jgi:hypothetical protein